MKTEMESALCAKVATLEAEIKAIKAAAYASVAAASIEARVDREYADELAEAVGGIDSARGIIAQHRLRKAQERRRRLLAELEVLDSLIKELADG